MPRSGDDDPEPRFRIGAVARATGIAPDTLRVWERRYHLLQPGRAEGGGRLYSEADIARLRLLKQLCDNGHAIGEIAPLRDEQLRRLIAREKATTPDEPDVGMAPVRAAFLKAVLALDLEDAQRLLARAALTLPARDLVVEFLAPTLTAIGDGWARGQVGIGHEHAASALTRSVLGSLLTTQGRPRGRTMVVTTLAGEMHELGALLVALLGASTGWRVVYLGPNLPAPEIAAVVESTGATLLALSMVNHPAKGAENELRAVARALRDGVHVILGGAAAHHYAGVTDRAVVLQDLSTCAAWLASGRVPSMSAPAK